MPNKEVLILGTASRGGIRSVIMAYQESGFYSEGHARFIETHVEGSVVMRVLTACRALCAVASLLFRGRVALMHLHVSQRGSFWRKYLFLRMGRFAKAPVIIHLHGSEFSIFYQKSSAWAQARIRAMLDSASGIVVLSDAWRDYVSKITDMPVTVIRNFVPDLYQPDWASRRRRYHDILFLGEFSKRKGIYDLLLAFSDVQGSLPDASLICCGNGNVQCVKELVQRLGLESSVSIPGWIGGEEKAALLHECGVLILPSYNEGLPMAIIEAMSHSMPVVSTAVGGIPELVDSSNGILIQPGDRDALSRALINIFTQDNATLVAMGVVSRKRYEESYSPQVCLNKMRKLYLSLGVEP